jgi:tetratricopeptide (TPR) repeat protein
MNITAINGLLRDASKYYHDLNYKNALEKVNEALIFDKTNKQARELKACILIESWDGSNHTQAQIMEAISHLKALIREDPEKKWNFLANIGNAYFTLAKFQSMTKGNKLNKEAIEDLMKAKDLYDESLEINENQPQIWVNKGNLLDYIGRHLEAIESYDRALLIDDKHYNAWGNRGICCWTLSNSVKNKDDKELLYTHAMRYIGIELMLYPDFSISEELKNHVKKLLSEYKIRTDLEDTIKEQLPRKKTLIAQNFNLYATNDLSFEKFFYEFCEKENFFLNIHFDCNNCGCSRTDLINFSFTTEIDEHKQDYKFFKKLYNILDSYITARFLLALAQYRSKDLLFIDKQRYEPDYSLNYIHNVELLKESFTKMVGICDKIAFFLKEYERLTRKDGKEIDDKSVSFWSPNSIFTMTDLLEKNNYQSDLVAMDTIRKDFEKGEFKNLRMIRDFLEHRYFILHDIVDPKTLTYPYDPKEEPLDDLEYHDDISHFYRITKKSLRLMRNLLFSLSFFVHYKEDQKISKIKGPVIEMYWSHIPEKDNIEEDKK